MRPSRKTIQPKCSLTGLNSSIECTDLNNSLQELARTINGDGKSAPNPLLKVEVTLESCEETATTQYDVDQATTAIITRYRVNFSPKLKQLAYFENSIG